MMLPLNWRLAEPELLYILNDAGALGIVYDAEFELRIPPLVAGSTVNHRLRMDAHQRGTDDAPSYEDAITSSDPASISG
jgi:hypothetical protein